MIRHKTYKKSGEKYKAIFVWFKPKKWIYIIKNLAKLENIPTELQEKIFKEVFEMSVIAKYDKPNRQIYEDSLKAKRDWKNSLDTSFEKGIEKGIGNSKKFIRYFR